MAVEISSDDRKAVPFTWNADIVEGEVVELWADNPADDTPMEFKKKMLNDGSGHVAFPADYTGACNMEVRGENDTKDTGTIEIT